MLLQLQSGNLIQVASDVKLKGIQKMKILAVCIGNAGSNANCQSCCSPRMISVIATYKCRCCVRIALSWLYPLHFFKVYSIQGAAKGENWVALRLGRIASLTITETKFYHCLFCRLLTPNKMQGHFWHMCQTQFFMLFHTVPSVLPYMVASITTYFKESDWLLKNFHQSENG